MASEHGESGIRTPPADAAPDHPLPAASMGGTSARPRPIGRSILRQLGRRGRAGAADYVYQIIIVIIGVFLGITFENMASERDRSRKAYRALDQLVADLRRDETDMGRIVELQQGQANDFAEIAAWLTESSESQSARIDSLLEKVVSSLTVYPRQGAYTSMIASGQVALLPQDLAAVIVNLYEHVYARLSANGEHYDYSLERDFLPSYADAWDPARQALITEDATERVRFRNHLLLMRAWSAYYSDLVSEGRAEVQQVVAAIDRLRGP